MQSHPIPPIDTVIERGSILDEDPLDHSNWLTGVREAMDPTQYRVKR
jgi:hypothetical protein